MSIQKQSKISIVILNWNGADMMRRFLPSVLKHSAEAEVVVADNGSTDDSLAMLAREFPSVRQVVLDKNYGFAEGYNRGLKPIEAEYYLLLNSDVEVREGWLTPMLEYMDSHPEVAACQPKLLCQWSPKDFEYAGACGGYIDALGYPYCRGRVMGTIEEDHGQYDDIAPVLWATGACLLIRSKDYWEVGGLDGRFFAHMEEIDLCWRLRSRGRRILCVPQSIVFHVGGATLNYNSPRKTFLNFRNNLLMLHKNLPQKEYRTVMAVRCLLDYVAAVKFLLTGDVANCKAVVEARREFNRVKSGYNTNRKENLQATVAEEIPERSCFSILWRYYARGCKRFSQIK